MCKLLKIANFIAIIGLLNNFVHATSTFLAAGNEHTCSLNITGGVECWGSDQYGQLGDGGAINMADKRSHAAAVSGITSGALAVTNGGQHSCALLKDRTVKCWGFNSSGQLGDGTFAIRSAPVSVNGLTGVLALTAGDLHTCALTTSGVKCWGDNSNGRLGIGGSSSPKPTAQNVDVGGSTVTALTAGIAHTCALLASGNMKCWGANESGQGGVGNKNFLSLFSPQNVLNATDGTLFGNVRAIAAGGYHTCALLNDQTMRCWGNNNAGQLGTNGTNDAAFPTLVMTQNALALNNVSNITTGEYHTCAALVDNTVHCWGANASGQLGDGSGYEQHLPTLAFTGNTVEIVAGQSHTCARQISGKTVCWGRNDKGQLGDATIDSSAMGANTLSSVSHAEHVVGGRSHNCALRTNKTVECWGDNTYGQLGNGSGQPSAIPVQVTGLMNVTQLVAGDWHTCALIQVATVSCWGRNTDGQLGNNTFDSSTVPTSVVNMGGPVSALGSGRFHTCAVLQNGTVRCWGKGDSGQLGYGGALTVTTPTLVAGISTAKEVVAGFLHTCALLQDNNVMCWGRNDAGQLGDGSGMNSFTPVAVTGLPANSVKAMGAGNSHACAILNDDSLRCWGNNTSGELGINNYTKQLAPVSLTNIGGKAVQMTGGGFGYGGRVHSCVLLQGGQIKCWGDNIYGQLGFITATNTLPAPSSSFINLGFSASSIAAGGLHSCAASISGISCWGNNQEGQLGRPGLARATTPIDVKGVNAAINTTAGRDHTCALFEGGSVGCWGDNTSYQLGDGSIKSRSSLSGIFVAGLSGGRVTQISAGAFHTCALREDGTVKCWGANGAGQLGNNSNAPSPFPTEVMAGNANLTDVTYVAASSIAIHTCAVVNNAFQQGALKCWGDNNSGQLGNNTTTNQNNAVDVINIANVHTAAVGYQHTCALLYSGNIKCWGSNFSGQLGYPNISNQLLPPTAYVDLGPGTIATSVVAGAAHSCALLTNGHVKCWGDNNSGQLGNNQINAGGAAPVDVVNLSNVKALAAGSNSTCALLTNGKVKCWGFFTGPGGGTYPEPLDITNLDAVNKISMGGTVTGNHFCGVLENGTMKCWGDNSYGQLGNAGISESINPVPVLNPLSNDRIYWDAFD